MAASTVLLIFWEYHVFSPAAELKRSSGCQTFKYLSLADCSFLCSTPRDVNILFKCSLVAAGRLSHTVLRLHVNLKNLNWSPASVYKRGNREVDQRPWELEMSSLCMLVARHHMCAVQQTVSEEARAREGLRGAAVELDGPTNRPRAGTNSTGAL